MRVITGLAYRHHSYQVAKDGSEVCPLNGVDAHDLLVGRPDQASSVHLESKYKRLNSRLALFLQNLASTTVESLVKGGEEDLS